MRNKNTKNQSGFTIIELLVVTAIMAIIATIGIVNWNTERSSRTLGIALNETVTNIRKVQGNAISSKTSPAGPAKFYLVKFIKDSSEYTTYSATGSGNVISPVIETIKLPADVTLSNISLDYNGRGPISLEPQFPDCIFIIYSVSYGKTYYTSTQNGRTSCDENKAPEILNSLPDLSPRANYDLTLTFSYKSFDRFVRVYGFSGKVESFNQTPPPVVEQKGTPQDGGAQEGATGG